MPYAAPSECSYPGCANIAHAKPTRCEIHRPLALREYKKYKKCNTSPTPYDARWRRLRRLHLGMRPLCVDCEREGHVTAGTQVDHIIPMAQGGARLDMRNLQTLCAGHHSRKTRRENRR